jgi:integrase
MPFQLYAPGTRKGNKCYIARVYIADGSAGGRRVEASTGTTNNAAARRYAKDIERRLLAEEAPRPGDKVSFAEAARLYAAARSLELDNPKAYPWNDRRRGEVAAIARLVAVLGKRPIGEMTHADLVKAANELYGGRAAATKNREALRPAAAILHYAAYNGLCAWLKVKLFDEPGGKTRAVSVEIAGTLVAAAPAGPKRLLLVWLFRQGTRISDTLAVSWEDNLDLRRQTVRLRIGKADEWAEFALHPELLELLAAIPEAARRGRLFPWRTKSGVYRWLKPLAKGLGVGFTPHMARHSVGTWLNEGGAGLKTIMAALYHRDAKSSIRYQTADIEIVRAATAGFAPITVRKVS